MTKVRQKLNIFTLVGAILLITGIVGGLWYYWQKIQFLVPSLSQDVVFYAEIEVDFYQERFGLNEDFFLVENIAFTPDEVSNWIGDEMIFGQLNTFENFAIYQLKNEKGVRNYLDSWLPISDVFLETETEYGLLLTPQFTSQQGFLLTQNNLIWLEDAQIHTRLFDSSEARLSSQSNFKKAKQAQRSSDLGFIYLNLESLDLRSLRDFPEWDPVWQAMQSILPTVAVHIRSAGDFLVADTNFFFSQNLTDPESGGSVQSPYKQWIPDSVVYASFGFDLKSQYYRFESFLRALDSRYEVLLSGILQERFTNFFGSSIDWQTEFLDFVSQDYVYGYDLDRGLNFFMVANLREINDPEKKLLSWQQRFQQAQARRAPKIERVEMPDGSIREELVASSEADIPVQAKKSGIYTYYLAQNVAKNQQFVYGIIDNHLVFAVGENTFLKILEQKANTISSDPLLAKKPEKLSLRTNLNEGFGYLDFMNLNRSLQSGGIGGAPSWPVLKTMSEFGLQDVWIKRTQADQVFSFELYFE